MPAIFISYRRDDTLSATGRLADTLAARFGPEEVFRDLLAIDAGADFRVAVLDALREARIVLVMIGRSWSTVRGHGDLPRLHDPTDYVRGEIEAALAQDLPIIPVLVEGARMPAAEELPHTLRALTYRQAHEISEARWTHDTERLVQLLVRNTGLTPATPDVRPGIPDRFRSRAIAAALARVAGDFVHLFYEPRRFLVARGSGSPVDLSRAFLFLIVSQLAAAALVLLEWPTRSPVPQFLATGAVLLLLVALGVSIPLYIAWRLTGAPREYQRVLVVLLYQCAFAGLIWWAATLVVLTGIGMALPDAVDQFAGNPTVAGMSSLLTRIETAPDNTSWVVATMIGSLLMLGLVIWLVMTSGAYRRVLHQSRTRGWVAMGLFAVFCLAPIGFLAWVVSRLENR